jgi:hypothetical protein
MASGMGPNLLRLRCKTPTSLFTTLSGWLLSYERFSVREPHSIEMRVQANALNGGPDNRQANVLGREDVNLIGALAHIAEETLDSIGGLNVPMH